MGKDKAICTVMLGLLAVSFSTASVTEAAGSIADARQAVRAVAAVKNIEIHKQAQQGYVNGIKAYKAGDYQSGVRYLADNEVGDIYGNKRNYNLALGDSYYHQKVYDKAIGYLKRAYRLNGSDYYPVLSGLGNSYFFIKDYPHAIQYLSKAEERSDALAEDIWHLSMSYRGVKNDNRELILLNHLVDRFPKSGVEPYYRLGEIYASMGKFGEAFASYETGYREFPKEASFYYEAGHLAFTNGMYEDAVKYLVTVRNNLSSNLNLLHDLGFSYAYLGKLDNAGSVADAMVKIAPNDERTAQLVDFVQQKQMERQLQIEQMNQTSQIANDAAMAAIEQSMNTTIAQTMP